MDSYKGLSNSNHLTSQEVLWEFKQKGQCDLTLVYWFYDWEKCTVLINFSASLAGKQMGLNPNYLVRL